MPEDKDNVLDRFKKAYKLGVDSHKDFFVEAERAFDFDGGDQWDDKDKSRLKKQHRPGLTINQVNPIVNTVSGSEITNRYETKYLPRTIDDAELNNRLTEVSRYIRQGCDAESEESAAFRDCVVCGLGATETYFDPLDGPSGRIVIERVPISELRWDPSARKMNLEDREWQMRGKRVSGYYFEKEWGKELYEEVKSSAADVEGAYEVGSEEPHDQTASYLYNSEGIRYDKKKDEVLVFDFQERHIEPRFTVMMLDPETGRPTDRLPTLSRSDFNRFREQTDDGTYLAVKSNAYVYHRHQIGGDVVLESGESEIDDFTIKFMTGFLHQMDGGNRIQWYGLVRGLFDPQSLVNKMLSQIVYIVSTNPKGAVLHEKGALADPQKARIDWGKPSAMIEVHARALKDDKVKVFQGQYPASMERVLDISMDMMPRVSSVNPFLSGQVDDLKRTAFSAVSSVQKQGLVSLSPLFDALRRYRKAQGVGGLIPKFIDKYIPEGTRIRITESPTDLQGEVVSFSRDWLSNMEFDVVVDEAPVSQTSNMEFWNSLMQTDGLRMLVEMGMVTGEDIADIMPDVPSTIRARMKENYRNAVQAAQQNPPPDQQPN